MKFNLERLKTAKTFFVEVSRPTQFEEKNLQRMYAFQQRVKSFNFAAIIIRLNVIHSMIKLSQFFQNSNLDHFVATDRVISYLYETKNLAIEYSEKRFSNIFLIVSDAAFADDENFRKSSDGYFFHLYEKSIN